MKKKFVVLEQGCEPNYPLTVEHKQQFNTEYSDCFRLNWKADRSDEHADFFKKDICWSEGRSYLYEQVKGQYEYYIFIDDDMRFFPGKDIDTTLASQLGRNLEKANNFSPAPVLRHLLDKYKPVSGTINNSYTPCIWRKGYTDHEAYEMLAADLDIRIYSDSFAKNVFPTWNHGSMGCMWYADILSHYFYPDRHIILNHGIYAINARHEPHHDVQSVSPQEQLKFLLNSLNRLGDSHPLVDLAANWRHHQKGWVVDSDPEALKPAIPNRNYIEVPPDMFKQYLNINI